MQYYKSTFQGGVQSLQLWGRIFRSVTWTKYTMYIQGKYWHTNTNIYFKGVSVKCSHYETPEMNFLILSIWHRAMSCANLDSFELRIAVLLSSPIFTSLSRKLQRWTFLMNAPVFILHFQSNTKHNILVFKYHYLSYLRCLQLLQLPILSYHYAHIKFSPQYLLKPHTDLVIIWVTSWHCKDTGYCWFIQVLTCFIHVHVNLLIPWHSLTPVELP